MKRVVVSRPSGGSVSGLGERLRCSAVGCSAEKEGVGKEIVDGGCQLFEARIAGLDG